MEIPLYTPQNSPVTSTGTPQLQDSGKGKGASILGRSISESAADLARIAEGKFQTQQHLLHIRTQQENTINELMERKQAQLDSIQLHSTVSNLRSTWDARLQEYEQNPTPDLLNTARKEYDDYTEKLLGGITSTRVRDEVKMHADEYRIGFLNKAFALNSQQQLQAFGASFDGMMSNAEDSIFAQKNPSIALGELNWQKNFLHGAVDDAVRTKQIVDKSVIQNLHDKVNTLAISWADATLPTNPEFVKEVISNPEQTPGVTAQHRAVLINKADEVIKTKGNQEKLLLREALQSDIKQRIMTGDGQSLDIKKFRAAYGEAAGDAAERDLANASKLYGYIQRATGASEESLRALETEVKPKEDPTSPLYGEQQDLASKVGDVVKQARSDKEKDAFTYFASNPSVKNLMEAQRQNPTIVNAQRLQDAVLELQKMDKSMQPYEYRIMPQSQADKFIDDFNKLVAVGSKADGDSVMQVLNQFTQQYGNQTNIALSQLNQTKGGDKITAKLNPLMWHLNNPTTFRMIVDSLRKDPQEQFAKFESDKIRQNFLKEVRLDGNLMHYANSMKSSNNSAESDNLVNGVLQTFRDFSRDYILNGGNMKDASSIFFANYTWGEKNGATYARPRTYADTLGKSHVMSEEQVALSNSFLDTWPITLNPDSIDPATILNQTEHFTPKELLKDTATALRVNTFLSTTEDETGVYLYVKGSLIGEPRQVKYKDGTPVRVNFVDSMKTPPAVRFGQPIDEESNNARIW